MATSVLISVSGTSGYDLNEEDLAGLDAASLAGELEASGEGRLEIWSGVGDLTMVDDLEGMVTSLCIGAVARLAKGEDVSYARFLTPGTITLQQAGGIVTIEAGGRRLDAPVGDLCAGLLNAADRYAVLVARAYPDDPARTQRLTDAIASARTSVDE